MRIFGVNSIVGSQNRCQGPGELEGSRKTDYREGVVLSKKVVGNERDHRIHGHLVDTGKFSDWELYISAVEGYGHEPDIAWWAIEM